MDSRQKACLLALLLAAASASAGPPPNVILVMADDMGWAQTSYYGHPLVKTPNLDDMTSSGLRLDRFYTGAPSCTPTRATVLTGRTNDRTGAARVGYSINKQEKMLTTAFRDAGFSTAHFGKWHLNTVETPQHPLPADDPHNPGELGFDYWLSETNQFNLDPVLSRNGERVQLQGEGSEVLVREALQFITEQIARDKPVFVVIWFASPHRPFEALDADAATLKKKTDRVSADHHAEIVAMDRAMGTLRQGLRELKIADSTLVWFTSDNGGKGSKATWELFNIIGDPGEQQNLIDVYPDIAARMRQELDAWNASVDRSMTGADYPEGRVLPSGRESVSN